MLPLSIVSLPLPGIAYFTVLSSAPAIICHDYLNTLPLTLASLTFTGVFLDRFLKDVV